MTMTTIYGIKNCDTVRKARRWLDQRGVTYRFHDFRSDGLDEPTLARWCAALGWETLLNRRGRRYRELPPERTENLNADTAQLLLLEEPVLIKRPVLEHGEHVQVGFRESEWDALFTERATD